MKIIGSCDDIVSVTQTEEIDEFWIVLSLRAEPRVNKILYEIRHSTVIIRLVPDIFGVRFVNHSITELAGISMLDLSAI